MTVGEICNRNVVVVPKTEFDGVATTDTAELSATPRTLFAVSAMIEVPSASMLIRAAPAVPA